MKRLRRGIRTVIAVLSALLVLLVGYGGWSLSRYGSRYITSGSNTLIKTQMSDVIPGDIYDRNGTLLAGSDVQGTRMYAGDAVRRTALSHLLGASAKGVETFMKPYLYGFRMTYFERVVQTLHGETRKGDTLRLTADAALMSRIEQWWSQNEDTAGHSGAVVVLNYKTGEVLAMCSFPGFDLENPSAAAQVETDDPYINRVTRGLYAPGSTFKLVTLAAALDTLPSAQTASYLCTGALSAQSFYSNQNAVIVDAGNAIHGTLTLKQAFAKSCNNTFAALALSMGDAGLKATAARLAVGENFLFRDLVVENSVYPSDNRSPYEIAWTGAGQSGLLVTPMHIALMAAGVANGGVIMEPRLLLTATGQSGIVRVQNEPRVFKRALTEETARLMAQYMRAAVTEGTGSAAALQGYTVCGKTGTSETGDHENAWFAGFLEEDGAPYALCVLVEAAQKGGGAIAAPLARQIFSALVGN